MGQGSLFRDTDGEPRPEAAPDALPALPAEVAEIAGMEAALRLTDRYGGTRVYVPGAARLDDRHPLVVLLGRKAAVAISERWQGLFIEVPRAESLRKSIRNAEIRRRYAAGESSARLARSFEMTQRGIWMVLKGEGNA